MTTVATAEELALFNELKDMKDFDLFPLPKSWYTKFNIKPALPESVKESRENNYAFQRREYNLSPILIDEPQRDLSGNIILTELQPNDELEKSVELIQKPFNPKDTNLTGIVMPTTNEIRNGKPLGRRVPQRIEKITDAQLEQMAEWYLKEVDKNYGTINYK